MGTEQVIVQNAEVVARKYKRRVWWAPEADLRQAAVVAQMEAVHNFDPKYGRPVAGYLFRVAVYAARRTLLKASAPVSHEHDLTKLVGLYRAPLEDLDQTHVAFDTERAYDAKVIWQRLEDRLGAEGAKFAFAVFVEGWQPAEIAEASAVPVEDVYRYIHYTRRLLESDVVLHQFWKEIE